jgi:hypothetical protein
MAAVDTFSLSRLHSLFSLDAIKVPFQQTRAQATLYTTTTALLLQVTRPAGL